MANRYWVGGTGTWDGTAGTKWSTTSGGAGGAAVPTAADDVFFDANSGANTVTVSGTRVAKSIDCTGFTGTLTNGFPNSLAVSGSVTFVAGMTYGGTGTLQMSATGTLTSGGQTIPTLTISATAGTVTLGDALNASAITLTAGTFDTSGSNYSITTTATLVVSGNTTRALNLNGSTLTSSAATPINISGANFTLNAGTSQIDCTNTGAITFGGANLTYYNVSFTGTSSAVVTINGANTFNNLSFTAPTATTYGLKQVALGGNNIINSTLTCSGAAPNQRLFLRSGVIGSVRTLTVATFAPTDCDFRDITISGAASPVSGTRLGDCGGNTNITFDAPKTVYWNPAAASDLASASWATSSGSTTLSANNFPLAQDTAIFDNNSRAGVNANQGGTWNVGTVDMSNRTSAFTFTLTTNGLAVYGDWSYGTGVTNSGSFTLTFSGRGSQTITSNGKTFAQPVTINGFGNSVVLADAFVCGTNFTITSGSFDAVSYNVSAATAIMNGTTTRTVSLGSGTWTLTGTGTVWNASTTTNLTLNKNTANIVLSNTTTNGRTFAGGGLTYNKLTIGGATGISTLTFSGSNTFSELASTKTVAHTLSFTAGITTTVGAWSITGTSGNVVTIQSATAATHTLTKTGGGTISANYLSISYSTATPATTWYAGANSTDGGNNSGWIFTAPPSTSTGSFLALF